MVDAGRCPDDELDAAFQAMGTLRADGLAVVAYAPDGIIEGAEWTGDDWWMVGAQWHPEELTATPEPWDRALFQTFAEMSSRTK